MLANVSHEEAIMGESSKLSLTPSHLTQTHKHAFHIESELAGLHLQHKFQHASTGITDLIPYVIANYAEMF